METLDEVISTMEYEAAYNSGELRSYDADALHYLKEYRSDQIQWEADRKNWQDQYAQAVENFKSATAKHLAALKEIKGINDPLIWDELKQMEGKPVWVEGAEHPETGAWYLIQKVDALVWLRTSYGDWVTLHKPTHGTGWRAYRKEKS